MKRKYSHIKQFEKEINEMFNNGMTLREIGERLGFTRKQMIDYRTRYNRKQRMIAAGEKLRSRGRPSKKEGELPPSIQRLDKLAQMRYVLASKERYIKRLESVFDTITCDVFFHCVYLRNRYLTIFYGEIE